MEYTGRVSRNDLNTLESLIGRYDVGAIIWAISDICEEKAEHLLNDWQDKVSADSFNHDALVLARAGAKIQN